MAIDYAQWVQETTDAVWGQLRQTGLLLDQLRTIKRQWAIPSDVMAATTTTDREAARAEAIHRGWQALVAAELDAESLLRSLRAVTYRLERGERPFTLPDIEDTIPEPEPLRLDPIEP